MEFATLPFLRLLATFPTLVRLRSFSPIPFPPKTTLKKMKPLFKIALLTVHGLLAINAISTGRLFLAEFPRGIADSSGMQRCLWRLPIPDCSLHGALRWQEPALATQQTQQLYCQQELECRPRGPRRRRSLLTKLVPLHLDCRRRNTRCSRQSPSSRPKAQNVLSYDHAI